jgi:hypothetical protein
MPDALCPTIIRAEEIDLMGWCPTPKPYWGGEPLSRLLVEMLEQNRSAAEVCLADDCNVEAAPAVEENKKTLEQRFHEEAEKWGRETAHMSSPLQKMMHPSYQAILGMSAESSKNKRDIIRFMLHDLKDSHREWSLALSYLTQHNPINPKDYGRTDKITAAWIRWGEVEGRL